MKFFCKLGFVFLFCQSVSAHNFVDIKEFPDWFQQAFQRDKNVTQSSVLEIEQLGVKGQVKGTVSLAEHGDTFRYYVSDIGSDFPIECYLFSEYDGPANSLLGMSDATLDAVSEQSELPISAKFNFSLNIENIQNTPYFSVNTLYTLGQGEKALSGIIKAASVELEQGLFICIHNEMGYRQAFKDVFESFARVLEASSKNDSFFSNAYQVSLNGIPVGFFREDYSSDAEGDIQYISSSAMLFPVDQSNFAKTDSVETGWSRPDGSLINTNSYSINNHEVASNFNLSFNDGKWTADGELQQKPVNVALKHVGAIVSGYGSYVEIQALLNSDQDTATVALWSADANPTDVIQAKLTKIKDDPNANMLIEIGPISMRFLADKHGILQKGNLNVGGISLDATKLYTEGLPVPQ